MSGQYYYRPHRTQWGVWKRNVTPDGYEWGEFVRDFVDKEEARREVYRLNGWKYKQKKL